MTTKVDSSQRLTKMVDRRKTIAVIELCQEGNYKEKDPLGQSLVSHGKTSSFQNPIKLGKEGKIVKRQQLFNIKSDLKSDQQQYGSTSCDHRDVRIVWERSLLHPYIILDVYIGCI